LRQSAAALLAAVALLLTACGDSGGQPSYGAKAVTSAGGLHLVKVGSFDTPTFVQGPPGDSSRLMVVEQAGRIRVVRGGRVLRAPFLDIRRDVSSGGERGLLSMAFAPDYTTSGVFYVYYTDRAGDVRIDALGASGDRADLSTRRNIITIPHSHFPNHNGGQLQFGPDGKLYAGIGDGGSEGDPNRNGQKLSTLLAKLIRIDPSPRGRYRVPAGNPFAGRSGARPEIWAYGLRNPYRFSFDRQTGDLVIADVGQNEIEEVNFAPRGRGGGAGANYGWSVYEGRHRYHGGSAPGNVFPVLQKLHSDGWCAIIGGYVVRDRALKGLYGRYLYGDNCKTGIRSVKLSPGHASGDRRVSLAVPALSSFGEDARGRVYVTSLNGQVYRLAAG
jgi:glucose/arabinose dehydrogenase